MEINEKSDEEFAKAVLVNDIINDPLKCVDELQDVILKKSIYTEGLATKLEIDNVDYFKTAVRLKYPEISDFELGKTILLSLGDSEDFIATLPKDKVIEATGYTSVVKTESFYKQTADGNKIEMSEGNYYNEIAIIEMNKKQMAILLQLLIQL